MDCAFCQSFQSMLDTECSECGFVLHRPRRAGRLYRQSAREPNARVKWQLRRWAHAAVDCGVPAEALIAVLTGHGYEEEWSRRLVVAPPKGASPPRYNLWLTYWMGMPRHVFDCLFGNKRGKLSLLLAASLLVLVPERLFAEPGPSAGQGGAPSSEPGDPEPGLV